MVNFSRQWPVPDIDVQDRDFFRALQADPELVSFVSEPVRNRATGTWVLHLARRIFGPNGEFRGIISGALELQYFHEFFAGLPLAPDSAVNLFRQDGVLLARYPVIESSIGRKVPNAITLQLVAFSAHGVGMSKGLVSGQPRITAAHRIAGYPIAVGTSKTPATALAEWRLTAAYLAAIATLTILAVASMVFFIIRLIRNYQFLVQAQAEQRKSKQLSDQNLRFDAALSNISQGLCCIDGERFR